MAGLDPKAVSSSLSRQALVGQTVLITGASRGIGAAVTEACLAAGATVVGCYCAASGVLSGLEETYGDRLFTYQSDLGEKNAAIELFNASVERVGRLSALVNNAGLMRFTPISAAPENWHTDWALTHQVNVQAVADLCQQFLLQDNDGPRRLVNIASRAAFRGDTMDALPYAASKGAVVALTRSIARGMAREGVRAFIVAPGWVGTDMAGIAHEPGNEWMLDEIPVGEMAPPQRYRKSGCLFNLWGM